MAAPHPTADLVDLRDSWLLALDAANKRPATIDAYDKSLRVFLSWLEDTGHSTDVGDITATTIRRFLVYRKSKTSPHTTQRDWRHLKVFFRWCVAEEEIGRSPMEAVEKPEAPKKVKDVFTDDEVRALLNACSGKTFADRRDEAIIRFLADTGTRVSGVVGIRYHPRDDSKTDVFLKRYMIRVHLKGGGEHWAPIGPKTAAAIDRYIRARNKLAYADSPWLWLPIRNRKDPQGQVRLSATGINQLLERRAKQAGLTCRVHPHKFRRTMAVNWSGDAIQLMRIGGWKSLAMPVEYTEAHADRLAREAFRQNPPSDRL